MTESLLHNLSILAWSEETELTQVSFYAFKHNFYKTKMPLTDIYCDCVHFIIIAVIAIDLRNKCEIKEVGFSQREKFKTILTIETRGFNGSAR